MTYLNFFAVIMHVGIAQESMLGSSNVKEHYTGYSLTMITFRMSAVRVTNGNSRASLRLREQFPTKLCSHRKSSIIRTVSSPWLQLNFYKPVLASSRAVTPSELVFCLVVQTALSWNDPMAET